MQFPKSLSRPIIQPHPKDYSDDQDSVPVEDTTSDWSSVLHDRLFQYVNAPTRNIAFITNVQSVHF